MDSIAIGYWAVILFTLGPALLGIFVFRQYPIEVEHIQSGIRKTARLGWSWTYYYFGFFVPIFRGEIRIGLYHLIITVLTFGLFQIAWSFLYNKQHLIRLLTNGWRILPDSKNATLAMQRLGINQ